MLHKVFSRDKSFVFLFTVFILLQLVFSAQDPGYGVDVGDEYLLGEVVYVDVNAPDKATVNLSIRAPDGSVESFYLRDVGSFTHLYSPPVAGGYCVSAGFYVGSGFMVFDRCFSVVSPVSSTSTSTTLGVVTSTATTSTQKLTSTVTSSTGVVSSPGSLQGVGIKVGTGRYVVGETVGVGVSAPEGATVNLSIIAPDNSTESVYLREVGSFTHLYEPSLAGRYRVSVEFFYGSDSVVSVEDFLVDDDLGSKLSSLDRFNVSVLGVAAGGMGCGVNLSVGRSFVSLTLEDVSDLRDVRVSKIKSALVGNRSVELRT
ncbi:MAG: hypothetical protein U9M95_03970, partial [Candidatus Altiarchaeota archaeon]|nr:hypothetical protein [Candidatus Altiarchaeota archaeon]